MQESLKKIVSSDNCVVELASDCLSDLSIYNSLTHSVVNY